MTLAFAGLACFAAGFLICWRAYRRGRVSGFAIGYGYGERDGWCRGFSRGVALTNRAWEASVDAAEPLLVDLTEGGARERN